MHKKRYSAEKEVDKILVMYENYEGMGRFTGYMTETKGFLLPYAVTTYIFQTKDGESIERSAEEVLKILKKAQAEDQI